MKDFEASKHKPLAKPETIRDTLTPEGENDLLAEFTPEQQAEIERKRRILSSLAYFIGKDFEILVELNEPGAGWHYDFKKNIIRIDPKDLLEKDMNYLRFVISHEGGHRRISRTELIPLEEWQQPGFAFMINAIEDPRNNNFIAENYPKFIEQMVVTGHYLDIGRKLKERAQKELGYQPRFMQAGFEYIKQWYRERMGEEMRVSDDLPDEVKAVVKKTLASARDSWWRYPSRQEADESTRSEVTIRKYAQVSYEINRDKIWPEFKKLVEQDMEDQEMQEFMKSLQQDKAEAGDSAGLPTEMKDTLTPKEQKELAEAIDKAIEAAQKHAQEEEAGGDGFPIDTDAFSPELTEKMKQYLDSLPEKKKQELKYKAYKALREFGEDIADDIGGQLSDNPTKAAARREQGERMPDAPSNLEKDTSVYEQYHSEVLPIIDRLETDLRRIFVARRARALQSGFRTGKHINIKHRIQEKAKGIPVMESTAWQRRELPHERDCAVSLLVDLSGSMQGEKIRETFKAVIVLSEVLNKLLIATEVLGFNDRIYKYQQYGEQMSKEVRKAMGGMLKEVAIFNKDGPRALDNDDGWALSQASKRIARQRASMKFIIVLSDGKPKMGSRRKDDAQLDNELKETIKHITKETDQKLIGLGVGNHTEHVNHYYPNSIANVTVKKMAEKLAELIRKVIEHYNDF